MTKRIMLTKGVALAALVLGGCATMEDAMPTTATEPTQQVAGAEIGEFFEKYDAAQLSLSPLVKAYRGIRDEDYGKWGDVSDAGDVAEEQLLQATADAMRMAYDPAKLSAQDALSYRLFDRMAKRSASLFPYRHYGYIFDQMNGAQSDGPAFLINIHSVADVAQARDYISRITGTAEVLDTLRSESAERAADGVMPPKWVYAYVIDDIENILKSNVATGAGANPILADFAGKVAKLDIADGERTALVAEAQAAWLQSAAPAYQRLLAEMKRQQQLAGTDDGVWRFPQGEAYYNALLANYTTTDLTADQIHNIGLREVERIHDEMRGIMKQVGFKGDLQSFFEYARTDPKFYYTTREAYLADVQSKKVAMEAALPRFFSTLPKDPLVVKPVEAFREKSAGKAFYQRPAPDGSRPGTYYVNLYNLKDMSKNELEALFYHEGLPGHHLQLSIQTALGDVPPFRRFGGVTAYTEGWGLYSEELGKDMGFYQDPYSDFGRLGMELWRAGRLVVDTGLHSKRWSREQAIDVAQDQHAQSRWRHRKGNRTLYRLSGAGDRLHDRQAEDHGAARPCAGRARRPVRHPCLPRCRSEIGSGPARYPRRECRCMDCGAKGLI